MQTDWGEPGTHQLGAGSEPLSPHQFHLAAGSKDPRLHSDLGVIQAQTLAGAVG